MYSDCIKSVGSVLRIGVVLIMLVYLVSFLVCVVVQDIIKEYFPVDDTRRKSLMFK